MNLSISNIGWHAELDKQVYQCMKQNGFSGLEIAPTRVFPDAPYDKAQAAAAWAEQLKNAYGFTIPSIQSIWYGRQERLFGSPQDRETLVTYTKKAIDFAATIGCRNLVFGCPRNRLIPEHADPETAIGFFREIGHYAEQRGTVIGMEANPPMYHTNYINDTPAALDLIEKVHSAGFRLNLDIGTMIVNHESLDCLDGKVSYINHVHISEPGLKPIQKRTLHTALTDMLKRENYRGFVSIEMGCMDDIRFIDRCMNYLKEITA